MGRRMDCGMPIEARELASMLSPDDGFEAPSLVCVRESGQCNERKHKKQFKTKLYARLRSSVHMNDMIYPQLDSEHWCYVRRTP